MILSCSLSFMSPNWLEDKASSLCIDLGTENKLQHENFGLPTANKSYFFLLSWPAVACPLFAMARFCTEAFHKPSSSQSCTYTWDWSLNFLPVQINNAVGEKEKGWEVAEAKVAKDKIGPLVTCLYQNWQKTFGFGFFWINIGGNHRGLVDECIRGA